MDYMNSKDWFFKFHLFSVQTRRGDLEILCYNIIQWLGCTLPWENIPNNPLEVQNLKETHMKDLNQFLEVCFGNDPYPGNQM